MCEYSFLELFTHFSKLLFMSVMWKSFLKFSFSPHLSFRLQKMTIKKSKFQKFLMVKICNKGNQTVNLINQKSIKIDRLIVVVVDLRITAQKKKLTLKHFFFGFLNLNWTEKCLQNLMIFFEKVFFCLLHLFQLRLITGVN